MSTSLHSQSRACQRRSHFHPCPNLTHKTLQNGWQRWDHHVSILINIYIYIYSIYIYVGFVLIVLLSSPTVEEVTPASNGTSETATEEVTAAAKENGTNGTHEAEKKEETTTETEKAESNGEAVKDAATEEEKDTPAETEEATKRKADEPSEDETSEKIAKLKETAAEVVAEAEQKLPEEPLTEAEATA